MNNKYKVAILAGGPSTEHKISLISAKSILKAINKENYEVFVIGIDHQTNWWWYPDEDFLTNPESVADIELKNGGIGVRLDKNGDGPLLVDKNTQQAFKVDIFFPVLHGSYGEDGVLQGYLNAFNAAFVGVDLLAASAGMDKDIAKRIWTEAGIPVARSFTVRPHLMSEFSFQKIQAAFGMPVFVKPANAGSSVGVSKVENKDDYDNALEEAFKFDKKVLVEEAVIGKEVECAVLGNEFPEASVLGEIIPKASFYSFDAKYMDDDGASMAIPADVPENIADKVKNYAILAFKALDCEGLSRVDFFVTAEGRIVLNEINTLPGFTSISMYPKLWEASGLPYSQLIDKLIQLGLARHARNQKLIKSV